MTEEQWYDSREKRRFKAEDRAYDRMTAETDNCEYLIGELCREGNTVYYIFTRSGKTKEFISKVEAQDYLIRNGYVTSRKCQIPASSPVK